MFDFTISNILSLMSNIGLNLIWAYSALTEIFGYTIEIAGSSYNVWTMIFTSSGLAAFVIFTLAKWIVT